MKILKALKKWLHEMNVLRVRTDLKQAYAYYTKLLDNYDCGDQIAHQIPSVAYAANKVNMLMDRLDTMGENVPKGRFGVD